MRWRVILEKKFSTAFSQEVEAGVKWKVPLSVAGVDSVILGRAFRARPIDRPDPSSIEHQILIVRIADRRSGRLFPIATRLDLLSPR
jgi:hypothetical protein